LSRNTWTPEQLILLRRNLTDHFSEDELRALCSEIGIDYERLRGQGQAAKASELVRTLAARGRIPALVTLAARLRPTVSWGDVPAGPAARQSALADRRAPADNRAGATLGRLSGLVVAFVLVAGLIYALRAGLNPGRPGPILATPVPVTAASARVAPTPTPAAPPVTPTPPWTPTPPAPTSLPPTLTDTPLPSPTGTMTPALPATGNLPRSVTLLSPVNGVCVKPLTVTFKWTGAYLMPGESFLVAVMPAEVNKAQCTGNTAGGVQYSPPLRGGEWTTDLSAPAQALPACAGPVEWTVYIRNAAGSVVEVAPLQFFEWNPLRCR
jgi:hypothetical protein